MWPHNMNTSYDKLVRIGKLYIDGHSMEDIAENVGVSSDTVSTLVKKSGLTRKYVRPMERLKSESWAFRPSGKGSCR